MKYQSILTGKFIARDNRFIARVEIAGREERVHVKNTGRCQELLLPGVTVYLEDFAGRMGSRKLRYSLIAVEKVCLDMESERAKDPDFPLEKAMAKAPRLLINMDSQAPNKVVGEALARLLRRSGKAKAQGQVLEQGQRKEQEPSEKEKTREGFSLPGMGPLIEIKPEKTCGDSRLDFFVRDEEGREGYIEVKGVTLEREGHAYFPDAPTERGIKHLNELRHLVTNNQPDKKRTEEVEGEPTCANGQSPKSPQAYALFVIQMEGMHAFSPNEITHPAFGEALRKAQKDGVKILVYDCRVTPDTLELNQQVPLDL